MGRPRINGQGKKRKSYQRTVVEYSHKRDVLNYNEEGHSLDETIAHFYGELTDAAVRAKKKQINKWAKQSADIRAACESGRGRHQNLRSLGDATVLSKAAEASIVLWLNSLRKDGAPVSRLMLQLEAKETASDIGLGDKFAASPTWIKLFLKRHKLSLRARTRQGQTTPEDALEAARSFRTLVLQTITDRQCVQVYNADQTGTLVEYRTAEERRQHKREELHSLIARARKDLTQERADDEVKRLQDLHTEDPFKLKPPNRADITEWVSTCWTDLSKETIVSGFDKIGIISDTRTVADLTDTYIDSGIVEELENCNLADGHVDSDDDIESDDDLNSNVE
ncbi:hypothetical protein PInf_024730 [Phytophthora infestans]|nr:hypothetical protein PInf_024730 [Phytophthora infestans]